MASTRNVVRPNVETIYAAGTFDLSATDLVLTVPPMDEDRFYLLAFYDPRYGDTFASLGSVSPSAAGKYLLRSTNSSCDGYEGCITSPTTIGTLLVRIEVKNNSTDVAEVDSYLLNSTLTSIKPRTPSLPALTLIDFTNLSNATALSALQLTTHLESRSPPETALFKAAVPGIFALPGIRNGSYSQPASVNLTLASALVKLRCHGWSTLNNSYCGTFDSGTAIIPRALTAVELYLQNTASNSIYPTLGLTQQSPTDSEAYRFTFSGKPPVADDGFWSLTMYDGDGYLVSNKENTYAVRGRSNITFPSGDLDYGNDTKDGSFQVLVPDADVSPPSNWTT